MEADRFAQTDICEPPRGADGPDGLAGVSGMLLQLISQARQPRQASFIDAFLMLWKKT